MQVKTPSSFLEHLLYVQRKQRRTAYELSSNLEQLSKLSLLLRDFGTELYCRFNLNVVTVISLGEKILC